MCANNSSWSLKMCSVKSSQPQRGNKEISSPQLGLSHIKPCVLPQPQLRTQNVSVQSVVTRCVLPSVCLVWQSINVLLRCSPAFIFITCSMYPHSTSMGFGKPSGGPRHGWLNWTSSDTQAFLIRFSNWGFFLYQVCAFKIGATIVVLRGRCGILPHDLGRHNPIRFIVHEGSPGLRKVGVWTTVSTPSPSH